MKIWLIVVMVLAIVLGGYITASLILFRYPTLIHKRKQFRFKPKHISHRGGAAENLENTLTAFRNACEQKTEMLELDCHITADGIVVVSHDNNLHRTCGLDINVSDTKYEDLPLMKSTLPVAFYPGEVVGGADCRIPTLRDVFSEFPSVPINIDIKIYDEELIQKVNDLIVEFNREDLCLWGSFQKTVSDRLQKTNPNIMRFFSMPGVVKLVLLFYTGLLPFIPLSEVALEVMLPLTFLRGERYKELIKSRSSRFLMNLINTLLIRKSLFKHLEKRGIQTYLWVLNEEWEYDHAYKVGATGVMTDFPTKLKTYLESQQMQPEDKDHTEI